MAELVSPRNAVVVDEKLDLFVYISGIKLWKFHVGQPSEITRKLFMPRKTGTCRGNGEQSRYSDSTVNAILHASYNINNRYFSNYDYDKLIRSTEDRKCVCMCVCVGKALE